jgi:hypothetical protein
MALDIYLALVQDKMVHDRKESNQLEQIDPWCHIGKLIESGYRICQQDLVSLALTNTGVSTVHQ